ncbi:MAG: hypothetical protein JJE50_01525 [Actinomycetales bacterium]|nr:hypothetical protein [Actinomycetales bacterium]
MSAGVELIAAERRRQVEAEGWTVDHDAAHGPDDLALAAVCYAMPERVRGRDILPAWPWTPAYWKPTPDDRVRELVKAGALIAAEIDRLIPPAVIARRLLADARIPASEHTCEHAIFVPDEATS